MRKIANATELQRELHRLLAYSQTERPSRTKIASELRTLSAALNRVSAEQVNIRIRTKPDSDFDSGDKQRLVDLILKLLSKATGLTPTEQELIDRLDI